MKTDLQRLRPADLIRILNTAGMGEVMNEARMRRQRNAAGFSIGDERTVNLLKYTGWLVTEYFRPKNPTSDYDEKKRKAAIRSSEQVLSAQDIGEIPEAADPPRKAAAMTGFRVFCETYFGGVFHMKWSEDHLTVIDRIEQAVMNGGLFAIAMPRGSGKSSLCQVAVIWAALNGRHPFVCLIASAADRGRAMLENIKVWMETNPLLIADFPEVCYPIMKLGRIANRQKGQKCCGEPTRIEWGADRIVLPTIAGSISSGVVISCSGMHGSDVRGQVIARPDGTMMRPSLVLIDDPQTTESAWSPSQCERRESVIAGDVLGMAGPGQKIAGLMTCTVIRPGDMADSILDREKHPEWQGRRTKLVYEFPENTGLWDRYAEIRSESLRSDGDGSAATEFYRENREAMDRGARAAWPDRFNEDEISAIQHAMNLRLRNESAFFAEYQNDPIVELEGEESLTAEQIISKTNGYERRHVPLDCQYITTFIDVHQKAFFWMTCAWERNFTGYVLDYGVYPDQQRAWFTLRDVHRTLDQVTPGAGPEATLYAGLEALCEELIPNGYYRDDGAVLRVDRCVIDANWGQSTDVVCQFCKQSRHSGVLLPSHGKGVTASSIPFSEYRRQRGDKVGSYWRIPNTRGKRQVRHLLIDTNYWKTFVHSRLAVRMGDPGCVSLFGRDEKNHRLLSDHLTSEYRVCTSANGRRVDEWSLRATLAQIFHDAGYRMAAVGKWHLGLADGRQDWNAEIRPGLQELGFSYSFIMPATNDRTPRCIWKTIT